MFWLRNKKNNFLVGTLIWRSDLVISFLNFDRNKANRLGILGQVRYLIVSVILFGISESYLFLHIWENMS